MKADKIERLKKVAQLYFLEDKTQQEIAQLLNVSRPLISRMLGEARNLGIVEIHIGDPKESKELLLSRLHSLLGIKGGLLVSDIGGSKVINQRLAESILLLLRELNAEKVGWGWGYLIGEFVAHIEKSKAIDLKIKEVFPLIGNGWFPVRNYHSNENIRIIAEKINAVPHYFHFPAFAESMSEKEVLCNTELYQKNAQKWDEMDTAVINIGNHPSTPDFASSARFGNLLVEKKAQGRLLAYYFDSSGEIIQSDTDYAIQIPMSQLKKCKNIIGVCSANINLSAFKAALKSRIFTHIIAREQLAEAILK